MSVPLGPFELESPIARGGMATVWKASHREQRVPVAIKVVTAPHAQRAEFERRFADEVRAVAALDHPGIVMVLDHGRIDPAAARALPKLAAGSPWLAMEYVSGGTLAHLKGALPWPVQKRVLLALLDALAHAHAHGLVHRDLKPANVLVANASDARPGIKLSDFGIAWAGADTSIETGDRVAGTPAYMAPEQIRGDWRDFGPWTDLYALGCLAWWLACGSPPFTGPKPQATMLAHLSEGVPPLHPRVPVPEGYEAWLRRLLEKPFERRFQFAADAAAALAALELPPIGPVDEIPELDPTFQETLTSTELPTLSDVLGGAIEPTPTPRPGLAAAPRPSPVPPTWRCPLPRPPPLQLVGAGLSLYGLRAVQLAGREVERDLLWSELRAVAASGRARLVLIHGAAGTGKSRLVEWICRRAHELGAATWCKASFAPDQAPGEAIQQMGNAYLRTAGLPRVEVAARVERFLARHGPVDEAEADVLTELLCPATEADVARGARPVRLTSPREYYAGTRGTMFRAASERPLIAWLDDVQWGLHGLGLAIEVLRSQEQRPFPCLLLLTMRNESLDEHSDEARRLEKLMHTPGATALPLPPLPRAAHRELVRNLLGLDDALAARVEERTGGNPLFAVQLVGSWVQDGTLEVGGRGFRLRPGARVELPDDLHAVWSQHLGRILEEFPPQAQDQLEIAACLGQEVTRAEWRRACDDPQGVFGDRFPGDEALRARLVERLLVHRLIVGTRDRWSFVHGMLRESLERTARQAGRWRLHHESCATMLAAQGDDPKPAERLGRHLLEAGQREAALHPLLRGVEHRLVTVGPQPARALLAVIEDAMRDLPESDRRWGRLWTLSARTLQELGEPERALEEVRRAANAAQRHRWPDVRAAAGAVEARLLVRLRRLDEAGALLERLFAEATDDRRRAAVLATLGEVARRAGDLARAAALLDRALVTFPTTLPEAAPAWEAEIADALVERGRVAEALGDAEGAATRYREALERFERLGAGVGGAECLDRLGRLQLQAGDAAAAEASFLRALSRYEALGSERQLACRMRLARTLLRRDPERVWPVVERTESLLARLDHPARLAAGLALALVRHALDANWAAWDETFAEVAAAAPRAGAGAYGAAWLASIAGEAAILRGERRRGEAALLGAAQVFRLLGDRALAEELTLG